MNNNKMIISYRKYTEIRDADWQLILDLKIGKLPVKISEVLDALGIEIHTRRTTQFWSVSDWKKK